MKLGREPFDNTTDRVVAFLVDRVGNTWEEATQRRTESRLGIANIGRGTTPWEEVVREMSKEGDNSVPAYVASHVRDLTSTFYTFSN